MARINTNAHKRPLGYLSTPSTHNLHRRYFLYPFNVPKCLKCTSNDIRGFKDGADLAAVASVCCQSCHFASTATILSGIFRSNSTWRTISSSDRTTVSAGAVTSLFESWAASLGLIRTDASPLENHSRWGHFIHRASDLLARGHAS